MSVYSDWRESKTTKVAGEMLERDAAFGSVGHNDVGPRLAFSTGSYYTLEFN